VPDLKALKRYAVSRTLFRPTTLLKAIERLGYVQADPIRAPARAQDLILRHRVKGYREGDLDRAYAGLPLEETFFINYGFVLRDAYALMHPRRLKRAPWSRVKLQKRHMDEVLEFVAEKGEAHPRDVDARFSHGTVENYWGGQSSATTHLLDDLHYRGHVRVVRRENGIRIYGPVALLEIETPLALRVDALIDLVVGLYAPVPRASLATTAGRLRWALPQHAAEVRKGIARARERLSTDGEWYWPASETPKGELRDEVRLLAPFDPLVWDRRRFEQFWGWEYRLEAYTPAPKRKYGYYALPLLWRDEVIGWANVGEGVELGFVKTPPRDAAFRHALDEELARLRAFRAITRSRIPTHKAKEPS
jgi:uncharacterized protein YcaQ